MLRPATDYIHPDEKCMALHETNVGGRRIQRLIVVRHDALSDYVEEIGPAVAIHDIECIGGFRDDSTGRLYIEETVATLREIAEKARNADPRNIVITHPDNLLQAFANKVMG